MKRGGHVAPHRAEDGTEWTTVTYLPSDPFTLRTERTSITEQAFESGFLTLWESLVLASVLFVSIEARRAWTAS